MSALPHDTSDLRLAPVILALDDRLDELGLLSLEELIVRVAFVVNADPGRTHNERESQLLEAVQQFIDSHGWTLSWDPRGVRLTHGNNSLVLGIPATLAEYVSDASGGTSLSRSA